MVPFRVEFRPGISLYEQVVYAAKKAIVSAQLRPGDCFPSVRELSRELKINPNTAHKIVAHLLTDGLLESSPGIGTVVAKLPETTEAKRAELLGREIEELVVEAGKLAVPLEDILAAVETHWKRVVAGNARGKSYRERRGRS